MDDMDYMVLMGFFVCGVALGFFVAIWAIESSYKDIEEERDLLGKLCIVNQNLDSNFKCVKVQEDLVLCQPKP